MNIFDVLSFLGGLAFFLYGMHVLSAGLEKAAGGKMQSILQKITGNRVKGLAVGAAVTAVIQSSSAVTVMLVGLVNAGIMQLSQAISVTMGSNIGTTITAWVLSLTGIRSDNLFLELLKPANFSPVVALVGAGLLLLSKKEKGQTVGSVCIGFAVLMYGMTVMSDAVSGLADLPGFTRLLTAFSNPVLGVLAGAVFTAVIQSSSASVGVLQALSLTGAITFHSAIPIIMGQNIGTCVSALMAIPGANKNAKRVAVVHVLFNCFGTLIWLAVWSVLYASFRFSFAATPISPVGVATIHSIFNIATTLLLLPCTCLLEKLSRRIIKGQEETVAEISLDPRLLTLPAMAVAKALSTATDMADTAQKTVSLAWSLFDNYEKETADTVSRMEKTLDRYEDTLGTFLVKVSRLDLTDEDADVCSMLLHTISDFERIGDHANNMMHTMDEIARKQAVFSGTAKADLAVLQKAVQEILSLTVCSFKQNDTKLASDIEPLEQAIDTIIDMIRSRHIARLQQGDCTIEQGFVLTDLLTDCERISDHCSNVGVAILETAQGSFATHARLGSVKKDPSPDFLRQYEHHLSQYPLPEMNSGK